MDKLRQELDQDERASQPRWKRQHHLISQIQGEGLRGIILDIISLGGEIPLAANAELTDQNPPGLPAA